MDIGTNTAPYKPRVGEYQMPRIIKNFADRFNAVKASKVVKAQGTDTLKAVEQLLGKNFEKVPVGGGMELPFANGDENGRKTLMTARARLVSVTRTEQPWAGRKYSVTSDPETKTVLIMRDPDGDPLPKKTGGRKAGTGNKAKAAGGPASLQEAMGMAKEHLNPDNNNETTVKDLTA